MTSGSQPIFTLQVVVAAMKANGKTNDNITKELKQINLNDNNALKNKFSEELGLSKLGKDFVSDDYKETSAALEGNKDIKAKIEKTQSIYDAMTKSM